MQDFWFTFGLHAEFVAWVLAQPAGEKIVLKR